jgi:hypothetical protein
MKAGSRILASRMVHFPEEKGYNFESLNAAKYRRFSGLLKSE